MDAVSLRERLRRELGSRAVKRGFELLSWAGRLSPRARLERHDVEVLRDIPYQPTGRPEHLLDVYLPTRGEGPFPVVFYVHGGGFRILSKNTHWIMGLLFARRGYVVFNINYRLAPDFAFPAALEDAAAALEWVRDNASTYLGDADRLVFAGESAGANVATALAAMSMYRREEPWARRVWESGLHPRVVVPMCGMLQISEPERFRELHPNLSQFVFERIYEVSEDYLYRSESSDVELADPLHVLEQGGKPERPLPAWFVSAGTRDPLVSDSMRLEDALRKLGATVEARYPDGEVHAYQAFVWRQAARAHWRELYEFLEAHV